MRLSQPRQFFAALLVSLTFPQIIAAPINTDSTDLLTTLQRRTTPPPPDGQVTPPGQVGGSPGSNPSPIGAPMKPGRTTNYLIGKDLAEWIESQGVDNWCHIPAETGGCEIWVQVGFTNYIKKKYGIPAGIGNIREQRVFAKSGQAADFTFPPSIGGHGKPPTRGAIVELKVESSARKGAALVKLVEEDRKKLADGVKEEYKDYDKMVLAIAWTEPTQKALREAKMVSKGGPLVRLVETKDKNGKKIPAMSVRLFEEDMDSSSDSESDSLGLNLAKNLRVGE